MVSKRTKTLAIDRIVRLNVMDRDNHRCIVCGSTKSLTIAHYINRGKGGVGIEQNLVVLCLQHHFDTDQSVKRKMYLEFIKSYLKSKYKDWSEEQLYYGFNKRVTGKDKDTINSDNKIEGEGASES